MATYESDFESLSGNLGTTANANAGNAYQIQNGGAATSTWSASTDYAREASGKSLKFVAPSTQGTGDFAGFGTGGEGNLAMRAYIYLPSLPASGKAVPILGCFNGSTYTHLVVESSGALRLRYGILYDGGTSDGVASAVVSAASWFRLEVATDGSSTEVRWFTGGSVENAAGSYTGNMTSSSSGRLTGWPILNMDLPLSTSDWSFASTGGVTLYYDRVKVVTGGSTKSWIGPYSSSTTHDASATRATTATTTAAATLDAAASATRATTATLTAAAAVERAATATLATAATIAAEATVERFAEASLTVTATSSATPEGEVTAGAALAVTASVSAAADVETPGVVDITATLPITATPAATAVLERIAEATAATTATITAAADVTTPGSHDATASVSVTATVTAGASVATNAAASLAVTSSVTVAGAIDEETVRGLMAGIERAASTMTPITGAGNTPRRVSLLSIDTATMTALVSMTEVPGLAGVPVFIGGDSSPLAAGLVAAGTAYLWISNGVVYYEDGS